MKNKRGLWFGEEAGKIVLGIIGIILMLFLLFKLIGILIQKTEYEQARAAMKEIEDTINSLKEGEVGYAFIEGPKNWYLLTYFTITGTQTQDIPQTCSKDKDCLCFCKENNKKSCETVGVCKSFENKEIYIKIPQRYKKISPCIKINEIPLKIKIFSKDKKVVISNVQTSQYSGMKEKEFISGTFTFEEFMQTNISFIYIGLGVRKIINTDVETFFKDYYIKEPGAMDDKVVGVVSEALEKITNGKSKGVAYLLTIQCNTLRIGKIRYGSTGLGWNWDDEDIIFFVGEKEIQKDGIKCKVSLKLDETNYLTC